MFPLLPPPPPKNTKFTQPQRQNNNRPVPGTHAYFLQLADQARLLLAEHKNKQARKIAGEDENAQPAPPPDHSFAGQFASIEESKRLSLQQRPPTGAPLSHILRYQAHIARQEGRNTNETREERWQRRMEEQKKALAELRRKPNGAKKVTFADAPAETIPNPPSAAKEQQLGGEEMNWHDDIEHIRALRRMQGVSDFQKDVGMEDATTVADEGGVKMSTDEQDDRRDSGPNDQQRERTKRQMEMALAAAAHISDSD